jgi:uncharacterized repeat protein (TIGR01451 family)
MTSDILAPGPVRRAALAALALLALLLAGGAAAQADDIVFEVEILRVDLVRGEDGEPTERFTPVEEAIPGEVIEYRVTAVNEGDIIYRPGTVVVTLPIGEGVAYVEDSATPSSDRIITEFSADGGETFSEPPVLVPAEAGAESDDEAVQEDEDAEVEEGEGDRRAADPAEYDAIRWTFSVAFEPGQEETLVYRVEVR